MELATNKPDIFMILQFLTLNCAIVALLTFATLVVSVTVSFLNWYYSILHKRHNVADSGQCADLLIYIGEHVPSDTAIVYNLPQYGCKVRVKYKFPVLSELVTCNPIDYRVNLVC